MDIQSPLFRLRAALAELRLDMRVRILRRRERQALGLLGAAAVSVSADGDHAIEALLAEIGAAQLRLKAMEREVRGSLDADRADFATVAEWVRPVIVLRGLCGRGVLRHQMARHRRGLTSLHVKLAELLTRRREVSADLSHELLLAVVAARADVHAVVEQRAQRLAPFGGSALPAWFPHVDSEARALARSVWTQVRCAVLPRSPALVGLAAGWWVADTYTDSQFSSVVNSLGIGQGGRRVVDGDTYRAMLFWLPVLSAGVCAYLADRAQLVIHRRYSPPQRGALSGLGAADRH